MMLNGLLFPEHTLVEITERLHEIKGDDMYNTCADLERLFHLQPDVKDSHDRLCAFLDLALVEANKIRRAYLDERN